MLGALSRAVVWEQTAPSTHEQWQEKGQDPGGAAGRKGLWAGAGKHPSKSTLLGPHFSLRASKGGHWAADFSGQAYFRRPRSGVGRPGGRGVAGVTPVLALL